MRSSEQISLYDYQLKEVNVRLVLNESSALYSTTPISTPQDAVNVMGELLRGADREMVKKFRSHESVEADGAGGRKKYPGGCRYA